MAVIDDALVFDTYSIVQYPYTAEINQLSIASSTDLVSIDVDVILAARAEYERQHNAARRTNFQQRSDNTTLSSFLRVWKLRVYHLRVVRPRLFDHQRALSQQALHRWRSQIQYNRLRTLIDSGAYSAEKHLKYIILVWWSYAHQCNNRRTAGKHISIVIRN